jgi:hypothetical protein
MKEHRMTKEEMEGPTSSWGLKYKLKVLYTLKVKTEHVLWMW